MWYIYTMEYYSAVRKKEILLFAITLMKLEGIMAKLNTSDRERQILYDITYMWNLNFKKSQTHKKTEWNGGFQGLESKRSGVLVKGYKLPVVR